MLKITLLGTLRNIRKNKLISLISIASLFIGLMIFSLALLYVKTETSYDKSWPDAERIHRMTASAADVPVLPNGEFVDMAASVYELVQEYFPEELAGLTRISTIPANPEGMPDTSRSRVAFVDAAFANIFQLETTNGSLLDVLSGPRRIALSERYALTLGDLATPGNNLKLKSFAGTAMEFEVAAIYRLPENISPMLQFDMISLIDDSALPFFVNEETNMRFSNWNGGARIWMKLKPGISTAAFNALQPDFVQQKIVAFNDMLGPEKKIRDQLFYRWQPVTDLHLHPLPQEASYGQAGDMGRVLTFAAVGMLVLLAACSNSISLSLSAILLRQREIGIRKAVGASRGEIATQYLCESLTLAVLGLVPVLAILESGLPYIVNLAPALFGFRGLDFSGTDIALLSGIALLVGLLNGAYPALVLSRYQPQTMLMQGAGGMQGSILELRSLLVLGQFFFAGMLLIGTTTLYAQLAYTRAQPLGFAADNELIVQASGVDTGGSAQAIIDGLQQLAGVESVLSVGSIPGNSPPNINSQTLLRKGEENIEIKAQFMTAAPGFYKQFEIPVVAGRVFEAGRDDIDPATGRYANDTENMQFTPRIVINRSAARAFGYLTPEESIGELVYRRSVFQGQSREDPLMIIGVVEDSMLSSLKYLPDPQTYQYYPQQILFNAAIKFHSNAADTIKDDVASVWQNITGYAPGRIFFLKDTLDQAFAREQSESQLLLLCAALAFFLSCIGLYALASFTMGRNVKEVGVRKVLGSGVGGIMQLFLWRFSKPIIVANIIAAPVAVYFVLQWIEQFPYQLEKAWLLPIVIGTAGLTLMVALLTVSWLTFRTASQRPVLSLRYE